MRTVRIGVGAAQGGRAERPSRAEGVRARGERVRACARARAQSGARHASGTPTHVCLCRGSRRAQVDLKCRGEGDATALHGPCVCWFLMWLQALSTRAHMPLRAPAHVRPPRERHSALPPCSPLPPLDTQPIHAQASYHVAVVLSKDRASPHGGDGAPQAQGFRLD